MSTIVQLLVALVLGGLFVGLLAFYGARMADRRQAAQIVQQVTARQIRSIQRRTLRQLVITAQRTDLMGHPPEDSVEIIDVEPDTPESS